MRRDSVIIHEAGSEELSDAARYKTREEKRQEEHKQGYV